MNAQLIETIKARTLGGGMTYHLSLHPASVLQSVLSAYLPFTSSHAIVYSDIITVSTIIDSSGSVKYKDTRQFKTTGSINHSKVIFDEIPAAKAAMESTEFGIAKNLSSSKSICLDPSTTEVDGMTTDLRNVDQTTDRKTSFLSVAYWNTGQNSSCPDHCFFAQTQSMKDRGGLCISKDTLG